MARSFVMISQWLRRLNNFYVKFIIHITKLRKCGKRQISSVNHLSAGGLDPDSSNLETVVPEFNCAVVIGSYHGQIRGR